MATTVAELIAKLQEADPARPIALDCDVCGGMVTDHKAEVLVEPDCVYVYAYHP